MSDTRNNFQTHCECGCRLESHLATEEDIDRMKRVVFADKPKVSPSVRVSSDRKFMCTWCASRTAKHPRGGKVTPYVRKDPVKEALSKYAYRFRVMLPAHS